MTSVSRLDKAQPPLTTQTHSVLHYTMVSPLSEFLVTIVTDTNTYFLYSFNSLAGLLPIKWPTLEG